MAGVIGTPFVNIWHSIVLLVNGDGKITPAVMAVIFGMGQLCEFLLMRQSVLHNRGAVSRL